MLSTHGLKCWGAVTLTLADRNLCAKDEKQRAASVDYMKGVVTMVKELRARRSRSCRARSARSYRMARRKRNGRGAWKA